MSDSPRIALNDLVKYGANNIVERLVKLRSIQNCALLRYRPGTVITKPSQTPNEFYLVLEGLVAVGERVVFDKKYYLVQRSLCTPGSFIGAQPAHLFAEHPTLNCSALVEYAWTSSPLLSRLKVIKDDFQLVQMPLDANSQTYENLSAYIDLSEYLATPDSTVTCNGEELKTTIVNNKLCIQLPPELTIFGLGAYTVLLKIPSAAILELWKDDLLRHTITEDYYQQQAILQRTTQGPLPQQLAELYHADERAGLLSQDHAFVILGTDRFRMLLTHQNNTPHSLSLENLGVGLANLGLTLEQASQGLLNKKDDLLKIYNFLHNRPGRQRQIIKIA